MNIIEALRRGMAGEKIKRDSSSGEWLTVCSDRKTLRYVTNRQVYHPSVNDMLAEDWLAENDFITVSNRQVVSILNELGITSEEQKVALKKLGFS